MNEHNGVVTDLTPKFTALRTELLPRVDSERHGIRDDFKSLFSIFKLKLSVDPAALLTLNPSDELDSVPKLCPECSGPLFMLFRKPRLCPCCKEAVLCDSCFQKHAISVEVQTEGDKVRAIPTQACAECARSITVIQDRARIDRALRAGASGAATQDGIALIYPEITRLIALGERRLGRFRDLCAAIHDSGAPEVSEVNGVVDQIKLCRAQVQSYVGKLRELKYPPRSSHQRMQDNLSIYAFEWLNATRAEFTVLSERLREALLRKPAADPNAPQIDIVVPMIAPLMGASPLLIRGRNFPPGTQVLIQDSLCRIVSRTERLNDKNELYTEITALSVPSKKVGTATVSVVAPDGKSATLDGFCYVPNDMFTESDVKAVIAEQAKTSAVCGDATVPAKASAPLVTAAPRDDSLFIQQVNPSVLPIKGGKIVIKALGVKEGVVVEINSKVLTPLSVSVKTGEITVKAPKCKVGSYSVKVMNSDGESSQMDGILFYSSTIKTEYKSARNRSLRHYKSFMGIIKGKRGGSGDDDSDFDDFDDDDDENNNNNGDENNNGDNDETNLDGFVLVGCEKPKSLPPMPPSISPSTSPKPSASPQPPQQQQQSQQKQQVTSSKVVVVNDNVDSQPQRRVWGKPNH